MIAIVSKPQNTAALLSLLHWCVDHIEKVIESHSPSAIKPPPPLPPKPSHVSKPVLPPKPNTILPIPSTTMKQGNLHASSLFDTLYKLVTIRNNYATGDSTTTTYPIHDIFIQPST